MVEVEEGQLPLAKRAGRPTKFNDATLDRLCAALADGMSIKSACVVAGIGVTTLSEWREEYPELEDRLAESRDIQARLPRFADGEEYEIALSHDSVREIRQARN